MTAQRGKWVRVSLPRDLLVRTTKLYKKKGMASPSEYVRQALIQKLESDEAILGGEKGGPDA